jgi:hypothetical protein
MIISPFERPAPGRRVTEVYGHFCGRAGEFRRLHLPNDALRQTPEPAAGIAAFTPFYAGRGNIYIPSA